MYNYRQWITDKKLSQKIPLQSMIHLYSFELKSGRSIDRKPIFQCVSMKLYLWTSLFFFSSLSLPLSLVGEDHTPPPSPLLIPHESDRPDKGLLEDELTKPSTTDMEGETFQAKFIRMLVLLGLLIGFMILASWALKRMMKTKVDPLNIDRVIKLLETRYLSPRATLHLVEIEGQRFIIGESPTAMTHIASLSATATPRSSHKKHSKE
jgi:flagellar biogenesis protein FliO